MALFTATPRRDRRRRRATQHRTWLRLPFLPRGNRVVRRPRPAEATSSTSHDAVPSEDNDSSTIPNSAYGSARSARTAPPSVVRGIVWQGLLRAFIGLGLVAVVVGVGVLVRHLLRTRPEFAIRAVRLTPTGHVPEERLRQLAGVAVGQNLFAVDLNEVRRRVAADPWVRTARVRRELPATISVEIEERSAAALVALESLYLVDSGGHVFKRAAPDEAVGHPVITGIGRDFYLEAPEESTALINEALTAARSYEERAVGPKGDRRRPPLGELHVDAINGLLLYTSGGTAIRLGRGEPDELQRRLQRLDTVLAALQRAPGQVPQVIYLDNRAHPDHVTVRLASATKP